MTGAASSPTSAEARPPSGWCDDAGRSPGSPAWSPRHSSRRPGWSGVTAAGPSAHSARPRASAWSSTSIAGRWRGRNGCDDVRWRQVRRARSSDGGFPLHAREQHGFVCKVKQDAHRTLTCANDCSGQRVLGPVLGQDGVDALGPTASPGVALLKIPERRCVAFALPGRRQYGLPAVAVSTLSSRLRLRRRSRSRPRRRRRPPRRRPPRSSPTPGLGRRVPTRPSRPRPASPTRRRRLPAQARRRRRPPRRSAHVRRSRPRPRQRRRRVRPPRRAAPPRSRLRPTASDDATPEATQRREGEQHVHARGGAGRPALSGCRSWWSLALAGAAGGTAWWRRRTGAP